MVERKTYIPNYNTLADLIDRLIVEVHKLAYFENKKREEHAKASPDSEKIAEWDNLSRDCCEYRSLLKREINSLVKYIAENREYDCLAEVRTFRKPPRDVGEILSEMCNNSANASLKGELVEAFKKELT